MVSLAHVATIGLPVLGAVLGAMCGWGAFVVGNRLGEFQTADLTEAQQTITQQKAEIEKLQPWQVSPEQRTKLQDELRAFSAGKIAFAHRLMDGAGKDVSQQLAAIFKSAGWSIGD